MQLVALLGTMLLVTHAGCSLVCYECGIPGTTSCEDAFAIGLVLAVPCREGSCVATSFKMKRGSSVMSKWCNYKGLDFCTKSRDMNFDTCATCSTSFCNGPLPPCDKQLKFVDKCILSPAVASKVVLVLAVLALLGAALALCVYYQRRRVGQEMINTALIAKYYSKDTFRRSIVADDMEYTKL